MKPEALFSVVVCLAGLSIGGAFAAALRSFPKVKWYVGNCSASLMQRLRH